MTLTNNPSTTLQQAWQAINQLTAQERLLLAKYILDSIISSDSLDETDWDKLALTSFEADWDNPDDAIYDNWRDHYDVPAR